MKELIEKLKKQYDKNFEQLQFWDNVIKNNYTLPSGEQYEKTYVDNVYKYLSHCLNGFGEAMYIVINFEHQEQ